MFGYFFGPIRSSQPDAAAVEAYRPGDAVGLVRFLDEAFVSGRWPIIATTDPWDRTEWPMPEFLVPDSTELLGETLVTAYAEDDPSRYVLHRSISAVDASRYPPDDGVFPPGHLEHNVGEWLGAPHIEDEAASLFFTHREEGIRHFLVVPREGVDETRRQLVELGLERLDVSENAGDDDRVWISALQPGKSAIRAANLEAIEARLTEIAKAVGGAYDGPEWAALPEDRTT